MLIFMKQLKRTSVVLLAVVVATMFIVQWKTIARLQAENRELQQAQQNAATSLDVETLSRPSSETWETEGQDAEHAELMRLRGEVALLRQESAELRRQQEHADETLASRLAEPRAESRSLYHAAETWGNVGYAEPQSAAVTFLWALSHGDQSAYTGAFGREMPSLEDAWIDSFKSIKGTFFSKPERLPNGDVRLNVAHETVDGNIVTSLITFREQNGQWQIRSMAGYPVGVLDIASTTAKLTTQ
jgi:hypothetical protein